MQPNHSVVFKQSRCLGLDIGGANLKIADPAGRTVSRPFPLWKFPERLAEELVALRTEFFAADPNFASEDWRHWRVGVTMTGELCDCFENKQQGVEQIVAAAEQAWGDGQLRYYQTTGQWATAQAAVATWSLTAASNWHALACQAAPWLPNQTGILLDIGSTTTDLIPIAAGQPCSRGTTDFSRLLHHELLYTGVVRSPVCAVVSQVQWNGQWLPAAHECFANMLDVYLLTGDLPESDDTAQTLDGRPATRLAATRRLARMWGAEPEDLEAEAWPAIARQIAAAQFQQIRHTLLQLLARQPQSVSAWLVSGQGDWLAAQVARSVEADIPLIRWRDLFSDGGSQAAPAVAIAQLLAMSENSKPSLR